MISEKKQCSLGAWMWATYKINALEITVADLLKEKAWRVDGVKAKKKFSIQTPMLFPHEWQIIYDQYLTDKKQAND